MPNCFTLTRKSDPQAGPVPLAKIDEEMCKHFGVPVHISQYYGYWYDIYGFAIAVGGETIRGVIERNTPKREDDELTVKFKRRVQEIGEWLDANFTPDAWAEVGRGK